MYCYFGELFLSNIIIPTCVHLFNATEVHDIENLFPKRTILITGRATIRIYGLPTAVDLPLSLLLYLHKRYNRPIDLIITKRSLQSEHEAKKR